MAIPRLHMCFWALLLRTSSFWQVFARKSNRNETPRNTGHVNVWCLDFFRLNQKEMLFNTLRQWKTVFLYVKTMKTYDSDIMFHQPFCVTQKTVAARAPRHWFPSRVQTHDARSVLARQSTVAMEPRNKRLHTQLAHPRAQRGGSQNWTHGALANKMFDLQSASTHLRQADTQSSKLAHPWSTTDRLHKWGLSQVGKRDMLVLPSPLLSLRLLKHVFLVGAVLHVIPRGAFQTGNVKICHISWIATAKSLNNVAFWRVWVKWVWHPSH